MAQKIFMKFWFCLNGQQLDLIGHGLSKFDHTDRILPIALGELRQKRGLQLGAVYIVRTQSGGEGGTVGPAFTVRCC